MLYKFGLIHSCILICVLDLRISWGPGSETFSAAREQEHNLKFLVSVEGLHFYATNR